jgi:DNA-binding CsgD family transcriptional regulator
MTGPEFLSSLIGDIYDAALDRALWPSVLEKTCAFVGGATSAIAAMDPIADAGQMYYTWGGNPEDERVYLEKYVRLNPAVFATMCRSKVGEVVSTGTVMPLDEFYASTFYREWAAPLGYCDSVWAVLERTATAMAAVSVIRHERHGLVDDETRRRMGLLVPHFLRAVSIGKVVDLHKVQAAALADVLDGITSALLLVAADGRVAYANASGEAMLDAGKVLRHANGRMQAPDRDADRALREVVAAAQAGDAAVGVKGVAVPLKASDGERFIAHVLPLTSGLRRQAGVEYAAVAAVFVRKAAFDLPDPVDALAGTYQLTPAELRVVMAIVNLGGVPEIAPVLGMSEPTVRTHLRHIFQKTGTNRQADLVKLVAAYMSPLAR